MRPSSIYPPYYTCRMCEPSPAPHTHQGRWCEPSPAPHTWVSGVNPAERPASAVLTEVGRYGTLRHGSGQGLSVDMALLRLVFKARDESIRVCWWHRPS